ncbi:unnamed protein product [Schistosoma mattheei]|uniref:Uncharacterized protein n=1 Tax=Schistosoma mattheei TaxID=31246 RepID=A0A183PB93_9TREM|nr:unnamed protein product [Schistosoma mattheei]
MNQLYHEFWLEIFLTYMWQKMEYIIPPQIQLKDDQKQIHLLGRHFDILRQNIDTSITSLTQ